MLRLQHLLRRLNTIPPNFPFSNKNNNPNQEFTPFQKTLGLDKEYRLLVRDTAVKQKSKEFGYGIPIALAVGTILFLGLSMDDQDANSFKQRIKLDRSRFLASIISVQSFQHSVFDNIHSYYVVGRPRQPKNYLQTLVNYLKNNHLSKEKVGKLDEVIAKLGVLVRKMPVKGNLGLVQRLVYQITKQGIELQELPSLKTMGQVLAEKGNLQQQYLGFLIYQNQSVSEEMVKKVNQNLQRYEKDLMIMLDSIKFKNQLNKNYLLFVLKQIQRSNGKYLETISISPVVRQKLLQPDVSF